ncbi:MULTISPECIES: TonB-dependent receptor [unclassified Janthinobacterium]|uniref:TonB-dependent receptor n=1 Tax=unclassified Janthinobacterium TaxID=2610881 RepID=UPI00181EFF44|nr:MULTISPECIES: TonB-dependent receptor [unclassified Janthinobacterium]MBB5368712.1 iron complex outermembrane receptor protein [Janthinobacterium sp. K2C7]MBB5381752.1 iron complex outermembrane receptor protein [Janthinobacterium sp. K2Li3]MBB5387094.1 iron complex outermembrane receptor protein [Janthinobacterium sp. K2E3]
MMTLHAGMVRRTLIALAVTAAFPLQAMADNPAPAPDAPAATQADTPAAAPAATGPGQLETVIVTAQRRAENIKDVPMSIATLKGEKLDVLTAGGQDIRFLSGRSPSVSVESDYGRTFPRFYIRGLGNTDFDLNASQPVGLVMDDVVQENAMLKGFPVFDVDQVEVLRGPQGTLFGRNSPAGVIKFDSAKPVFNTEGYLSGGFGKDGVKNLEGVFNVPLSDTVALRFSGQTQRRDNRVHNPRPTGTRDFEGYEDNAARIQLLVKPSRDFSALFNVHARDLDGTATLFRANILKQGTNDLVDNFDYGSYPTDGINRQHLKTKGGSMRLKWDLDGVTVNSITGYEKLDFYSRADVDGGYGAVYAPPMGPGFIPFVVETADVIPNHKQISQELRAESNSKGPWQWIAGLFYFKEDIQIDSISFDSLSPGNPQNPFYSTQNQSSTSYAAFGSLNYTVSDALKLRGGLRYTSDKKDFSAKRVELTTAGPFNIDNTSHNISWDLSGTYILTPATNVYARVATGYRAPSMQGRLNGLSDRPSFAGAEKALSVEAGIKQDLFDKRARLSLAVFQYRVKDKQLTAGSGAVNMNQLINADKVTGQGVELDFQANLSDSVSMTLGGSYNHTEIQDKNLFVQSCGNALNNPASGCTVTNPVGPFTGTAYINGNPLPRAPEWQGNFTLKYSIPVANGEFFAYTDWSYRTSYNFFLYEAKEYKAKPLLEGGLRAGYKWDKYEIAAYSRNITNRIQAVGAIDFDNLTGILNEPRTYGVQFKATF